MKKSNVIKKLMFMFVLVFCFSFFTTDISFAEKGDFYERHKDEIEKRAIMDEYIDLAKDYDYEKNNFDCGWTEWNCKIYGTAFSWAFGAIKISYAGIEKTVVSPTDIINNKVFNTYKTSFQTLSNTILAIFLLWNIMKLVAQRYANADDGMVAINDKLILVVAAGLLLGVYDTFIYYILRVQELAVLGVLRDLVSEEDIIKVLFFYGAEYGMLIALLITVVLFVFSIAFVYRYVLFGLLFATGVLAIPTMVNDEYNYFSVWLSLMINNVVTLFLQVISFSLGLQALINGSSFTRGNPFVISLAFFFLALMIPSLLGNMGSSSGTGRSMGQLARYIAMKR